MTDTEREGDGTSRDRVVGELVARITMLEAQVAGLQRSEAAHQAASDAADEEHWSRRALLLGGAGAVAGIAASAVAAGPAAAAAGDPALLGEMNNSSTKATGFVSSSGFATVHARNIAPGGHAVFAETGDGTAIGAVAASGGVGVRGTAETGWGVIGESTLHVGTEGRSQTGSGVRGSSLHGSGVEGACGYGAGVKGTAITGTALDAESESGPGVVARSQTGPALILENLGLSGPPTDAKGRTWDRGSIIMTTQGELWLCVHSGVPGTWRLLMSPQMTGAYVPITPARVFDSRYIPPPRQPGPLPLQPNQSRLISVATSYKINSATPLLFDRVPPGVRAVAVNVTVTNTPGKGWLSLQPGNISTIGTSCVNWAAGQTIANGLILTLDDQRQLNAFVNGSSADVIIDVSGYFRAT